MRLFNTMTRAKEDLPESPVISLYVCGVTPYDTTHLGHAFSYAAFDVLVRFLSSLGREVRYTQNVTDIDDDILRRARETGMSWDTLGAEQTALYQRDMHDLNILPPTHYPRATQEIDHMTHMITSLLDRGHAYQVGRQVYFSTRTTPDFGALARLSPREMEARFRETGDSPDNPEKRDRLDFVLWKGSDPGEPSWPSPWGLGRPGWHIECSSMAIRYLGPRIDIHGGGDDLIFPHHSCEIAQSEQATGQAPFARIWMHNGAVQLDGTKMSKSLGNLVMIRELLDRYSADAIRLYLFEHHYREAFEYHETELDQAAIQVLRLQARARTVPVDAVGDGAGGSSAPVAEARKRFTSALADDLDTPAAAAALRDLALIESPDAAVALRECAAIAGLRLH